MQKFNGYPIVVNYNLHQQLRNKSKEDQLYADKKYEDVKKLAIKTATTSDTEIEHGLWKKEIDQWESTICQFLQRIDRNPVGRILLGLINKATTVWIIPKSDDDLKICTCALTGPLNYEIQPGSVARGVGSGDTVIQFHPYLGDDTLFHELVHAYRYSYKKFNALNIDVKYERTTHAQTTEEVLAHQMENIYRSQGHMRTEMDYVFGDPADKAAIYDYLVSNEKMLQVLKSLLRHEYLAMLAAHTFVGIEYNPFRDFKDLEAKALAGTKQRQLPEFP